jgi:tetratricopeptide (TPR) repeat protein
MQVENPPNAPETSQTPIGFPMKTNPLFPTAIVCAISAIASPAFGQGMNLGDLVERSEIAMNDRRWEDALAILTEAASAQGGDSKLHYMVFGPRFGLIHYRKGLCEIQLQQWEAAIQSFEKCYRDFPNDPNRPPNTNNMRTLALLRSAEAMMGLNNWQGAIDQFKKFDQEKTQRDSFNRGHWHLNMATSHFQLGLIPEGIEHLETAINNKVQFDTPETNIIATFQTLVTTAINKKDEQVLIDFINKNRSGLVISPFRMQQFMQVFLKLAGEAFNSKMPRAAVLVYQLVPPTQLALEDARAVLDSLGGARGLRAGGELLVASEIQTSVDRLSKLMDDKTSPETIKLSASAFIHESKGNVRGAYAAYRLLEKHHPKAERREDFLYNLVRTASMLGKPKVTETEANKFLSEFPESTYVPAVRRLMLSSLFFNGDYKDCIDIAVNMLPTLQKATPEHDMCLFVLAGSYFYTGQYDLAKPLLNEHVEQYKESPFLTSARYFQASNESRLQFWKRAGELLDKFLDDFPDKSANVYFPSALFDRATVFYAEEQNDQAVALLDRVVKEFPEAGILDQVYNLRGNVLQSKQELEPAYESYAKALEIAEARGNRDIAGDALYYLTNVSSERIEADANDPFAVKAVEYAERYWKEFAEFSPMKSQMAVVQMKPLGNLGRAKEGLERLQKVISEMARNPEAIGLEAAINSYTEAYLKEYTLEQLREHYFNFPDIRIEDRAARALLRIAVIGAYEELAKKAEDEETKNAAAGTVRALFQELKRDFNPPELTNFILVKVGDYLRHTATPRESLAYYDEVLKRPDQAYRFEALLGRADVYGNGAPEDQARAIEDFERIFNDSQDRGQREFSLFRMVRVHLDKGEHAKAEEKARLYLDREKSNFNKYSGQVSLMLAETFDRANNKPDAIVMYMKVWSAYIGEIRVSAPAMKRWMELNWEQNRPAPPNGVSDRQGAYNGGKEYIANTERLKHNMTPAELAAWEAVEALVRTYGANPNIVQ